MATAKPAKSAEAEAPGAATEAAAPKKSKKKLFIILGVVILLLLGGGGGAAVFLMKKKAAAAAEAANATDEETDQSKNDKKNAEIPSGPPVFVVLEPFTVNLADKNSDRYAQVSVSLQVFDAKVGDELKLYMPAIKHNIFMVLAHKTSEELLEKAGKEALAEEILEEASRPLLEGRDPKKDKDKPSKPILKVHFANFIIQ